MNQDPSFGTIVKERRKALGLTQTELARRVGCATITVRKIEADALRPSVQIAERLAMALNIPLEERAKFVRLGRTATMDDPSPSPLPSSPLIPDEVGLDDLPGDEDFDELAEADEAVGEEAEAADEGEDHHHRVRQAGAGAGAGSWARAGTATTRTSSKSRLMGSPPGGGR